MSEELTDEKIKEFLETAKLYQWCSFGKPRFNRSSLWIEQIEIYCSTCQKERPFRDPRQWGSGAGMAVKAVTTGETFFGSSTQVVEFINFEGVKRIWYEGGVEGNKFPWRFCL